MHLASGVPEDRWIFLINCEVGGTHESELASSKWLVVGLAGRWQRSTISTHVHVPETNTINKFSFLK